MLRRSPGRLAVVSIMLAVGVSVCSCSSADSSGRSASLDSTGSNTAATQGIASGSAPSATAPGTPSGSPANAATTAAIRNAYVQLFAPDTPTAESIKVLQDGPKFRAALIAQSKSPLAENSSAKVTRVSLLSSDTAEVSFSILLSGSPILGGQTGYAVRQDGTWKVADKTFCGLLALNGNAPAACKTQAATTLPG